MLLPKQGALKSGFLSKSWAALLATALFVNSAAVRAQDPAAEITPPVVTAEACRYPGSAKVTDAYRISRPSRTEKKEVRLGDEIEIKLSGLADLTRCATTENPIVLFLKGRPLPGLVAYPPTDPMEGALRFELEIGEDSEEAWKFLLGSPA